MPKRYRTLYSPYGATELKRAYQRNQLIGNLATVSLALLIMVVYMVWPSDNVAGEPPDGEEAIHDEPLRQSKDIPPGYRVIREQPGPAPAQQDIPGAIPVPIADSLFIEDDTALPPLEPIEMSSSAGLALQPFGLPVGGGSGDDDQIYTPDRDEFIPLEKQPEMIREHVPTYPRIAKEAGIEGHVYIRALVDVDGSVIKAEIARSSGVAVLDESAVSSPTAGPSRSVGLGEQRANDRFARCHHFISTV